MTGYRAAALCAGLLAAIPPAAWAQERGFVGALGGVTFATETSSVFGAQAGGRFGRQLVIFGEAGRMQNVLPNEIQDQIDQLIAGFESEFGARLDLDAKLPAFYGMGGVRWSNDRPIAPFLEGAGGFARLSIDLTAEVEGVDISDEVERALDEEDTDATKFLMALGGGVSARLSDVLRLDAGYRYVRIFTDDPAINTSVVYASLKLGF